MVPFKLGSLKIGKARLLIITLLAIYCSIQYDVLEQTGIPLYPTLSPRMVNHSNYMSFMKSFFEYHDELRNATIGELSPRLNRCKKRLRHASAKKCNLSANIRMEHTKISNCGIGHETSSNPLIQFCWNSFKLNINSDCRFSSVDVACGVYPIVTFENDQVSVRSEIITNWDGSFDGSVWLPSAGKIDQLEWNVTVNVIFEDLEYFLIDERDEAETTKFLRPVSVANRMYHDDIILATTIQPIIRSKDVDFKTVNKNCELDDHMESLFLNDISYGYWNKTSESIGRLPSSACNRVKDTADSLVLFGDSLMGQLSRALSRKNVRHNYLVQWGMRTHQNWKLGSLKHVDVGVESIDTRDYTKMIDSLQSSANCAYKERGKSVFTFGSALHDIALFTEMTDFQTALSQVLEKLKNTCLYPIWVMSPALHSSRLNQRPDVTAVYLNVMTEVRMEFIVWEGYRNVRKYIPERHIFDSYHLSLHAPLNTLQKDDVRHYEDWFTNMLLEHFLESFPLEMDSLVKST